MRFPVFAALVCLTAAATARGQVMLNTFTPYTQNFDTLASTVGAGIAWSNNTTIPGWFLFRQPAPGTALTAYNAGTGAPADSPSSSFYSFGVDGTNAVTDRALGGFSSGGSAYFGTVATGDVAGWMAVGFTNSTGANITSVTVSYDGEQWRKADNVNAHTMTLEVGRGTSFTAVTTWTAAGSGFNFIGPRSGGTTSEAVDGNAAANRTAGLGGTLNLSSDPLLPSQTLWFRWAELNETGNDHGLALDNFSFTPVPEPATVGLAGVAALGAGAAVRRKFRPRAEPIPV